MRNKPLILFSLVHLSLIIRWMPQSNMLLIFFSMNGDTISYGQSFDILITLLTQVYSIITPSIYGMEVIHNATSIDQTLFINFF